MDFVAERQGGDLVVRVSENRVDAAVAVRFKEQMRDHFSGDHARVILDLSHVEFLDSSGLGAVVAVLKEVPDGKSFCLAGLTSNVEKVFRLTRMDTVFTIYPSVELAREGVAHAG